MGCRACCSARGRDDRTAEQVAGPRGTLFDRDTWLARAGDSIADAIRRRDTKSEIFHGCYDWHSAVHGHWALLRIARVTGQERFTEAATSELTPDRIESEATLLRSQFGFEMPYGRAWFLRLAIEHAAVTRSDRLREMADAVAQSLVTYFDTVAPIPKSFEYDNASWALAQLAAYARSIDDASITSTVQRHVEASFLDAGEVPDFSLDHERNMFFSPRGNWLYLIATTQPAATLARILSDAALDERILAPVTRIVYGHHLGMNWSRAWTLRRLALTAGKPADRALFQRAYEAHVTVGLREHENDRGDADYFLYGHWVPQFAVYALTEDIAGTPDA
jgi:hypothetical protein